MFSSMMSNRLGPILFALALVEGGGTAGRPWRWVWPRVASAFSMRPMAAALPVAGGRGRRATRLALGAGAADRRAFPRRGRDGRPRPRTMPVPIRDDSFAVSTDEDLVQLERAGHRCLDLPPTGPARGLSAIKANSARRSKSIITLRQSHETGHVVRLPALAHETVTRTAASASHRHDPGRASPRPGCRESRWRRSAERR